MAIQFGGTKRSMMRVCLIVIFFSVASWAHAIELKSVRSSTDQDSSRVVLELSGQPKFSYFNLNNPSRLVLDVTNLSTERLQELIAIDDKRITRVRTAVRSGGSRLVFDLAGPYRSNIFALDAKGKFPDRLVVDVVGYVAGEKASVRGGKAEELTEPLVEKRDIIVAIDPGHGGKDPGASSYGLIEKQVVLQISKRLARRFQSEPGYRAVLNTR